MLLQQYKLLEIIYKTKLNESVRIIRISDMN